METTHLAFEGSEKPSQGNEKVHQKLVHVMIVISRISPTDYLSRQRNLVDVQIVWLTATNSLQDALKFVPERRFRSFIGFRLSERHLKVASPMQHSHDLNAAGHGEIENDVTAHRETA
jgi:hypothetical protein